MFLCPDICVSATYYLDRDPVEYRSVGFWACRAISPTLGLFWLPQLMLQYWLTYLLPQTSYFLLWLVQATSVESNNMQGCENYTPTSFIKYNFYYNISYIFNTIKKMAVRCEPFLREISQKQATTLIWYF